MITLLDVHLTVVFATIAAVLYSDEQAFLWLVGKKERLSARLVRLLHAGVSFGLALLILTGGLLYIKAPQAYLSNTTFLIKMTAIAALIINTYAIERLSSFATTRPYASLTRDEHLPLFISGIVSVLGWSIAILCGYFLG